MVGPFIFFDEFGPAEFLVGQGLDIRPHPHIGLSTVTYLFDGELVHRDSLGTEQVLKPRALNLMTAGSGIVHSERTGAEARRAPARLFGLQAWAALPKHHEDGAPAFAHVAENDLPRIEAEGKTVRLVMGSLYGARSPAAFPHETFYAEAVLAPGAILPLDDDYEERAVYIVSGTIDIVGQECGPGRCSFSIPEIAFRSLPSPSAVSCFSEASRWMDLAISGGTSSRRRRSGFWRRSMTGCRPFPHRSG